MVADSDIQRVSLQPAYILHSRDFRDTSAILDVLTPEYGRISLLAKGVKQPNSTRRAILQPFRSLLISWQGRGDLSVLTNVEEIGKPILLSDSYLACGYYLSELVQRLLSKSEQNMEMFANYDMSIRNLERKTNVEPLLRIFEIKALRALGLIPDFAHCVDENRAIEATQMYKYSPERGVISLDGDDPNGATVNVTGYTLMAMEQLCFKEASVLTEAKKLMRFILFHHLGEKPLRSRELFHIYAKNT